MTMKSVSRAFIAFLLLSAIASAQTTRFVALGDSRGDNNGINEPILVELATAIIAEAPDLVVFVGDLVTNGTQSQLETWVAKFMDPLRAAGIQVYPIRGNHDSDIDAWNAVFSGAHALPQNGPPGEENLTYSFVYHNALFIGIDEYMPDHPFQVNQAWLDEQLAACSVPHIFTFGHLPAFAVYHTDCLASVSANRNIFWNSLASKGARTYFAGHDHFLDHARVAAGHGGTMEQYVVGAAGAPLYSWSGAYPEAAQVSITNISHLKNYSYAVVDVNGFDVTVDIKQKVAEGVYASTGDIVRYTAPFRGQGVPATGIVGLLLAALSVTAIFILRGYATKAR